jgi:ubiquinone biosynthesis protein
MMAPETIEAMARAEGRKARWQTIGIWVIALTFIGILLTLRRF